VLKLLDTIQFDTTEYIYNNNIPKIINNFGSDESNNFVSDISGGSDMKYETEESIAPSETCANADFDHSDQLDALSNQSSGHGSDSGQATHENFRDERKKIDVAKELTCLHCDNKALYMLYENFKMIYCDVHIDILKQQLGKDITMIDAIHICIYPMCQNEAIYINKSNKRIEYCHYHTPSSGYFTMVNKCKTLGCIDKIATVRSLSGDAIEINMDHCINHIPCNSYNFNVISGQLSKSIQT
jgi:hypothetical protein